MRGAAFILSVLLLLAGIAAAEPLQARIGVLSGISGVAAKWGKYQNLGIRLAAEELNAGGERIEVVFEDSATNSGKAISAYNKLLSVDKVDAVLADDFGFAIEPLIDLAARNKKLFVAVSLGAPRYCEAGQGYFFSSTSQFSRTEGAYRKFFERHPEVRRIALVVFDDPEWGQPYLGIWRKVAAEKSIEIVDEFVTSEFSPDFKIALMRAVQKKAQAVFLAHEPVSFLKAVRGAGFEGKLVSANNVLEVAADPGPHPELEGVYLVDPLIAGDFVERFRRRFNEEPILEAYAGYEALRSIAAALRANRREPQLGFRTVRYQGVGGLMDFTSQCYGNFSDWGLFVFRQGKAVEVQ